MPSAVRFLVQDGAHLNKVFGLPNTFKKIHHKNEVEMTLRLTLTHFFLK